MRVGIPSMKNVLKQLAKGVLTPSGLIVVASAADIKTLLIIKHYRTL